MTRIAQLLAFVLVALLPVPAAAVTPLAFDGCTQFFWSREQDRIHDRAEAPIYFQLGTSAPFVPGSLNTWITVDLTPWGVPSTAKFVFLTGLLVITHGTSAQSADIHVSFSAPSDTTADPVVSAQASYLWQTAEGNIGGGQRTDAFAIVPVENGRIRWSYWVASPWGWPTWSSYGLNVNLEGYCQ